MTMSLAPLNAFRPSAGAPQSLTTQVYVVPMHSLKTLSLMLTVLLAGIVLPPKAAAQTKIDIIEQPAGVEKTLHQPLASSVNPSVSSSSVESVPLVKGVLYESAPLWRPSAERHEVVVKAPPAFTSKPITNPTSQTPQVNTVGQSTPDTTLHSRVNITPPTIWVLMDTHLPETVWENWAEEIEIWTQRVQSVTGGTSPWAISALLWGMPGRLTQGEPDRARIAAIQTIAPWVQAGLPLAIDPPRILEVFFGSPTCNAKTSEKNLDPMAHPRLALPAVVIETPFGTTLMEGVPSFGVAVGSLLKYVYDAPRGPAKSATSPELAYWESILGHTHGAESPIKAHSDGRSVNDIATEEDPSLVDAKAIRLAKSLGVDDETLAALTPHASSSSVGHPAPRRATRRVDPNALNASNALAVDLFDDLLALGVEPLRQTGRIITEGK